MTDDTYESVKRVLAEHERLFTKLLKVAEEYEMIDFDESGFYDEEVERCERHRNTLSRKLAEALQGSLEKAEVKALKSSDPAVRTIRFDIMTGTEEEKTTTRLSVDFGNEGELRISRSEK